MQFVIFISRSRHVHRYVMCKCNEISCCKIVVCIVWQCLEYSWRVCDELWSWWACNLHSFSFSSPFLTIIICISLYSRIFAESARRWGLVWDAAVWIYYCRDDAETGRDDAELSIPRWRQFTKEVDCQIFKNKDGRLNFMNKTVPDHLNVNIARSIGVRTVCQERSWKPCVI